MDKMKISKNARNAIVIGTLCSVAYFAVYIARNMLSVVTPEILDAGLLTEAQLGTLSSAYFMFYAIGQLINGIIGDRIKAVYMISVGLLMAGVTGFLFPYLISGGVWLVILYGMTGFFLSMIYAPMTRVVAESTEPIHAVRCSLGYTFSSFFGSPAASLFAATFVWYSAFNISSAVLVFMAVVCFLLFTLFERRGIVKYGTSKGGIGVEAPRGFGEKINLLVRHDIVRYSIISMLTGIVRTAVVFWMPTYFSEHLGYTAEESAIIFAVVSLVVSVNTFLAVWIYEMFGRRQYPSLLLLFGLALVGFVLTYFISDPICNVILLTVALLGSTGASSVMWSVYCPSLADTGMVSSATGFLDFLSYMAAAIATAVFGNLVARIGWGNLLLSWVMLSALGVAVMLVGIRKRFMKSDKPQV